ncbi:MAG: RNA polymerase-binding protein DksA [Myxococcota bacterium]
MFNQNNTTSLPPDEYLSSEEVQQLREILTERAKTLLSNSQMTVNSLTDDNREVAPDALDLAASESSRDFSLRLAGRERQMLKKIRYALQRMEEGEYGVCEACGEEISFKRLLVRPVATLCIDCKTQAEQLERRSRSV